MNLFRLAGDMTHLVNVVVLLLKIHTIKSCARNLAWEPEIHSIRVKSVSEELRISLVSVLSVGFSFPCVDNDGNKKLRVN
ncbi:ER lumen protein retaining receptor [Hordeum vulgare]|nr:ER lumen protein retaining receptor [Hordeum vulgare]